jgi:serine/threonine-protein kinase
MTDHSLTRIGKYEIVATVGEGAMGVVYRAVDTVLNRTVAVKVMSDAIALRGDQRDRFLREAQAAGSLQHPNVITVYDFGEFEGHLFIAMEFVDGMDLEQVIARPDPLPLPAKLDVVTDVLTGLGYAHARGIVHRDIKPANIRITTDGRAKIMDFGVAHLSSSALTQTGVAMGTPAYMAPEQALGGKVTPATDVFAVGSVLYELLAGVKAFDGTTLHNVLYKIISEEPRDVSELVPALPPELGRIVRKALAKDVGARYPSALDMAADLAAVRASLGGASYAGTLSLRASIASAAMEQRRRVWQARRRGAIAAAAAVLAAAAAAIWVAAERRPATTQAPRLAHAAAAGAAAPSPGSALPATTSPTAPSPAASDPVVPRPKRGSEAGDSPGPGGLPAAPSRPTAGAPEASRKSRGSEPAPPAPALGAAGGAASGAAARRTLPESTPAPQPSPVVALPPPTPPPPAPAPPSRSEPSPAPNAPDAAEVPRAIAAYARAIESRDIDSVRRIYPGLSAAQERGFEEFFAAARTVHVTFSVTGLEVAGSSAEARLVGTYEYVTANGRTERQPVSFQAALDYEGGEWRLRSVR